MARLTDPDRLAAYLDALGNWVVEGCIYFKIPERAARFLRKLGIKERELKQLMYEYVTAGGEIDEVREVYEEYKEHEFHHDLRFRINDKPIYIETRLIYRPPFEPLNPEIMVVNVHE